jgi:hypothetical protein
MMEKMISSCGLDCANCPAYIAGITDDNALREKTAREWSIRYDATIKAEDIHCSGCRNEGAKFSWCNNCPIRSCAISRSYRTCAECTELPCEHNRALYQAVPEAFGNLQELRKKI